MATDRDDEVEREIRAHLELEAEERMADGMPEREAMYAARRAFGNVTRTREEVRRVWTRLRLDEVGQDVRQGIRVFRTSPAFTLVTVLTLALGIGANTAIFSLMDGVLFRPLPVTEPDRLVTLAVADDTDPNNPRTRFSYPVLELLRGNSEVLSSLIAYQKYPLTFDAQSGAERAMGMLVTGDYFAALGVRAALGRTLQPDDNRPKDGQRVAVLSYRFWQRRCAADSGIVGRTVRINGEPFTIVGVSQRGFVGTELGVSSDLWMPLWAVPDIAAMLTNPSAAFLPAIARLKPGITREQAQERTTAALAAALAQRRASASRRAPQILLLPGTKALSNMQRQFSEPLWVLMAIVALVLLIACCNVAGLLLIRGIARSKDMALRAALGASRVRLVRSLIVESLVLSSAGMLAGIAVAYWGVRRLVAVLPPDRFVLDIQPNTEVLGFSIAITIVVGVVLGLAPAARAMRLDLRSALVSDSPSVAGGGNRVGMRQFLVLTQVAFSTILLIGAGLFVRSLLSLWRTDSGVEAEQVIQVTLDVRSARYSPPAGARLYDRVREAVEVLPHVRSAAFIDMPLLGTFRGRMDIYPPGHVPAPGEDLRSVFDRVSGGVFETLGIPLVSGRDFSDRDDTSSRKVIIVNEPMARHFFGNENPVGRLVGEGGKPDFEIIGVVGGTKFQNLREESPRMVFLPFSQAGGIGERTLYVRTSGEPLALIESVRAAVRSIDPNVGLYGLKTFSQQLDETLVQERLIATLSAWFGAVALFLAAIGLYGLIHHTVQQRRREFGLRIVLGASATSIAGLALREALVLVGGGVGVGLVTAILLARVVETLLFGVAPADPFILAGAAGTMSAIALAAAALPTWRATRANLVETLKAT